MYLVNSLSPSHRPRMDMLMLGPENTTRCTWMDLVNSFCLVPGSLAGVPGLLPAELGHYLWDLSDLSVAVTGPEAVGTVGAVGSVGAVGAIGAAAGGAGELRLVEDLLGGGGGMSSGGDPGDRGSPAHGLTVGLLAPPGGRSSQAAAAAREAAEKLPNVVRISLAKADAPPVNVSLPGVGAWLLLPIVAEGRLREILQEVAGARGGSEAPPAWVVGGEMIAAGPDVLLLEGAMDVGLEAEGSDLFERAVTAGRCHAIRDARLC